MLSDIDLVTQLLSFEQGQAVPKVSHRQVSIHPDALVLCPVMMAGEDATLHALAIGRVGAAPMVRVVPDPRHRDDQYQLFEWLARGFEKYYQDCHKAKRCPQLWVSSKSALSLLDTLAERLRFNRQNQRVRRFGELLSFATERQPIAGQQVLLDCASVLSEHWMTGQSASEDEHLGGLLEWLQPSRAGQIHERVCEAESRPCGVKTDPDFDRRCLGPRVTRFNEGRREGVGGERLAFLQGQVEDALTPVVLHIYEQCQRAIRLLINAGLPALPSLSDFDALDWSAFQSFTSSRSRGFPIPLRDSEKAGVFKLAEREHAVANTEAARLMGDCVAQARALNSGRALLGCIGNAKKQRVGPRRFERTFDIESTQQVLHLRPGTRLLFKDEPRYQVQVLSLRREPECVRVSVRVVKGQRIVGLPKDGVETLWLLSAPDWRGLCNDRKQFKKRLAVRPWTHDPRAVVAEQERQGGPEDPLALVEALR